MVADVLSRMAPSIVRFISIFYILAMVVAQSSNDKAGPDPVDNFCSRWWSQSTIKNDTLYIDSGVQKYGNARSNFLGINNYLLTISLTKGWDWTASDKDAQFLSISREAKNFDNSRTGAAIPRKFRGHMFAGPQNDSKVYSFGGSHYMYNQSFIGKTSPNPSTYPLWSYTPGSGEPGTKWEQYNTGDQRLIPNHGAGADAPDLGLGFYLNGQIDGGTSSDTTESLKDPSGNQELYTPLDGMLVMDLVNPGREPSANISTQAMKEPLARVGGSLDYIPPVGDSGILVAMGGQIQPQLRADRKATINQGELIDFQFVDVFDIGSYLGNRSSNGTWYRQNTTGDVPRPRIDYCTVSVSAPDNSSHHIYLIGGRNPLIKDAYYDDVVVLSLPSFTWSLVWADNNKPRYGHNCHMYHNQIFTVGGNYTIIRPEGQDRPKCDWETKGLAVFYTETSDWGSIFHANNTSFKVPPKLLAATNGTSDGQATIGEPKAGWSDSGLRSLFWKTRWTRPSSWTNEAPPDDTAESHPSPSAGGSSDGQPPENKGSNTGALAGGLSAGLIGVAIVLAGLIYWHHRHRQNQARSQIDSHDDQNPLSEVADMGRVEVHGYHFHPPAEVHATQFRPPVEILTENYYELSSTAIAPGATAGMPVLQLPPGHVPARLPRGLRPARRPSECRRSLSVSSAEERSRRRRSSSASRRSSGSRSSTAYINAPRPVR